MSCRLQVHVVYVHVHVYVCIKVLWVSLETRTVNDMYMYVWTVKATCALATGSAYAVLRFSAAHLPPGSSDVLAHARILD